MQDENWQYYSVQRQEETLEENQAEAVDSQPGGFFLAPGDFCWISISKLSSWRNVHLAHLWSWDLFYV